MELLVQPGPAEVALAAAAVFKSISEEKGIPLFCIASGDTPLATYAQLHLLRKSELLDTRNWQMIALDEWLGLGPEDPGSCADVIRTHFTTPLEIPADNSFFFNGKTTAPQQHCKDAQQFIADRGGIDLAILGLGMNGHIGLNEPGTAPDAGAHVMQLDTVTATVGQKYFQQPVELKQGITLGLGDLLKARKLLLLATGAKKADIVKKVLEEDPQLGIPATWLKTHPSFTFIIDQAAAGMI